MTESENGSTHWSSPRASWERWAMALGATTFLAAATLLSFRLTHSIWGDEAYSIHVGAMGLEQIVAMLRVDAWPPLYYLVLHGWMAVFGSGEWSVRLLSGVYYVLATAVAALMAREVTGDRRAAIIGAVLYAANPMALQGASWARGYSLLGLLVTLSTWLYVRTFWRERPGRISFLAFAAVNAAGTLTHYWFFFFLAALGLAGLLLGPRGQRLRLVVATLVALLPFTALWVPTFLLQLRNGGPSSWMAPLLLPQVARSLLALSYGGLGVFSVAWAVGTGPMGWRPQSRMLRALVADRLVMTLVVTVFLTLALALGASLIRPLFLARYTVAALPPLVAALTLGVWRCGPLRALVSSAAMALAIVLVGAIWAREEPPWPDRQMATHLVGLAKPGDVVMFEGVSELGIAYYLARLLPAGQVTAFSVPAEVRSHPGWCWSELTPERERALEAELRNELAEGVTSPDARVHVLLGWEQLDHVVQRVLSERFELVATTETPSYFYSRLATYRQRD